MKVRQPGSHPACSHKGHKPLSLASGILHPLLPSEISFKLNFGRSSLSHCLLSLWGSHPLRSWPPGQCLHHQDWPGADEVTGWQKRATWTLGHSLLPRRLHLDLGGASCVPGPLSTSSQGDNTDDSHRFSPGAGVTKAPVCPQSWVEIGVRGPRQARESGRPVPGGAAHVPLSYALHTWRTLRARRTRTLIMYSMRLWECFSITDSIQIKGLTCQGEGGRRARLVVLESSLSQGKRSK